MGGMNALQKAQILALRRSKEYKWVLRMGHPFKQKWDVLIIVLAIFNCVTIPLDVAF